MKIEDSVGGIYGFLKQAVSHENISLFFIGMTVFAFFLSSCWYLFTGHTLIPIGESNYLREFVLGIAHVGGFIGGWVYVFICAGMELS